MYICMHIYIYICTLRICIKAIQCSARIYSCVHICISIRISLTIFRLGDQWPRATRRGSTRRRRGARGRPPRSPGGWPHAPPWATAATAVGHGAVRRGARGVAGERGEGRRGGNVILGKLLKYTQKAKMREKNPNQDSTCVLPCFSLFHQTIKMIPRSIHTLG